MMQYEQKAVAPVFNLHKCTRAAVKFSTLRFSNFFVVRVRRNVDDALACRKETPTDPHQTLAVPRCRGCNIGFLQSPCVLRGTPVCHAARQHHNGIRVLFSRGEKICHLAVTFGRDRAGVEDYDVRRFLVLRCGKSRAAKREESIASDSYWFTLQPRVMTFAFIIYFNFLSSHVVFFQPKRQLRPVVHQAVRKRLFAQ